MDRKTPLAPANIYAPDPNNLGKFILVGQIQSNYFSLDFVKCAHCHSHYRYERENCPNCGSSQVIPPKKVKHD